MGRDINIGRRIDRYEILEEIGRGGMAIVYRATDLSLKREVALKLLHPHLATHLESRQRFRREAQAVARLRHPALLEIYDFSDEDGDDVYIVMELVRGTTLRRFVESRNNHPVPAEAAALILRQVCAALATAHDSGIIHRDVKPENILIGERGDVKLSDFGIAHLTGLSEMTTTGQILGSPAYMSPEHIEQVELDARADLFSVGTVLYEIAGGRPPFVGKNPAVIIRKIVEGDYPDPLQQNPALGQHLAAVIRCCLQPERDRRYRHTAALVAELESFLAAMGIGPIEEELTAYFDAPDDWEARHRREIIERTMDCGLAARKARGNREALDHFNRVLALEPGNLRALEAVAGMSRKQHRRRLFDAVIVVLPVLVAAAAILWTLTRDTGHDLGKPAARHGRPATSVNAGRSAKKTTSARADKAAEPKTVPVPAMDAQSTDERPGNGAGTELRGKPEAATSKKSKARREVVFTPFPMAVAIDIDGRERFPFGPANRSRTLEVGRHTITFVPNDPQRFTAESWTVEILPGEEPFSFRERLAWRPASLLVSSNVDTVVTVQGRATGKTNTAFPVRIEKGPEENAAVVVSATGFVPETRRITISAGELTRITITLPVLAGAAGTTKGNTSAEIR